MGRRPRARRRLGRARRAATGPRRSAPSRARGAGPGPSARSWRSAARWSPPSAYCRARTRCASSSTGFARSSSSHRPRQAEQVLAECRQRVPDRGGPGLVEVVGQQGPAVRLRACSASATEPDARAASPRWRKTSASTDTSSSARRRTWSWRSCDGALAVAECTAGVVRRLVQPRVRGLDADAGPECVHDLLAVHAPPVREGQQLHQRGSAAPAPGVVGHLHSVGDDGEASEQRDVDQHVRASIGIGPHGCDHAIAAPPRRPSNSAWPTGAGCQDGATPGTRPRRSWPRSPAASDRGPR